MSRGRIDGLARFLRRHATSRRAALAGVLGAFAWTQTGDAAQAPLICVPDGGFCGVLNRCCAGLLCNVPYTNPISGVCRPGTDASGTGIAVIGPSGQVTSAQAAGTAVPTKTPRPTKASKATRTPRPTKTPRADPNPDSLYSLKIELTCGATPERTRIENVGSRPVLLDQIDSDFASQPFPFSDSGEQNAVKAATLLPSETVSVWTQNNSPDEKHVLTTPAGFFPPDDRDAVLTVIVQKLKANRDPVSPGGEFLEYRAFCDGRASRFIGRFDGRRDGDTAGGADAGQGNSGRDRRQRQRKRNGKGGR
jgi:hypothetical protein